jgi:hypothetical protein
MSARTPGPWVWMDGDSELEDMATLLGDGGNLEVIVCHFGNSAQSYPTEGREPDGADKVLIAAAPDLLAACEAALGTFEVDDCPAVQAQLRAAIAKARGQ